MSSQMFQSSVMFRFLGGILRNVRIDKNEYRFWLPRFTYRPISTPDTSISPPKQNPEKACKRFNPLKVQMLSSSLHEQVFHGKKENYDPKVVKRCQEHLEAHTLWGKSGVSLAEVDFKLPPLLGSNIDEHFCQIAELQSKAYFEKAQLLAGLHLSPIPDEWSFSAGWTKYVYSDQGLITSPVDVPGEDALVFDVEVCVNEGPFPVLAVAVSATAW